MGGYTIVNLREVEDQAPKFGFSEVQEARFPWRDLGATSTGLAFHRVKLGKRQAFAHRHEKAEEVYVILSGSGRVKLDDEVRELRAMDADSRRARSRPRLRPSSIPVTAVAVTCSSARVPLPHSDLEDGAHEGAELYDRTKTVVREHVGRLQGIADAVFHPEALAGAHHYGFRIRLCKPYRPKTKGKVESDVG